jgi:2-keto-4-pentenoate hydratase/2-oxohepta-3-ene-1,7-dioic acid hydratase in catechol pathway
VLPRATAWFFHRRFGERRLGLADPAGSALRLLDLGPAEDLALLAGGLLDGRRLEDARAHGTPLAEPIAWDVPVARPGKVLCLGRNYAAHAAELGNAVPEAPLVFNKLPETLLPHEGTVLLPHWLDSRVDHEIELAAILGFADPQQRGRKYVAAEDALELVAGYTIVNDVTARALQGEDRKAGRPWLRSKSFDTFCPIGPWVVPRAALPGAPDLAIELAVNGATRQSSRTSLMLVGVAEAIAWLSRQFTLRPGDIVATGTPEGVGPLQDGDRVAGTVEGIGTLAHAVARERDHQR